MGRSRWRSVWARPCRPAAAIPIGASLTQAPNAALTCPDGWPPAPTFFPLPNINTGRATCTWTHSDISGGQSLHVPVSGTIIAVRVRVGRVTGPMQVAILRSLYQNTVTPGQPTFGCCSAVAVSVPFVPTANAITTVPVNLPVIVDPTPAPHRPDHDRVRSPGRPLRAGSRESRSR